MRTVLLWHAFGEGDAAAERAGGQGVPDAAQPHYDWLLEREGPSDAPLIAFRTLARPDDADCHRFTAVQMADHRRVYLHFEGALSGGRGSVRRVAEGVGRVLQEGESRLVAEVDFGNGGRLWEGAAKAGGVDQEWEFVARGDVGSRK